MPLAYTRRLGRVTLTTANVFVDIYTADARTTVVRDLVVVNFNPATSVNVQLAVLTRAPDIYRPLLWTPSLAAGVFHLDLRQELEQGETLTAAGDHGNIYVWATGYVFEP